GAKVHLAAINHAIRKRQQRIAGPEFAEHRHLPPPLLLDRGFFAGSDDMAFAIDDDDFSVLADLVVALQPLEKARQALQFDGDIDDANDLRIDLEWRRGADAGARDIGHTQPSVPARAFGYGAAIPGLPGGIVAGGPGFLFTQILNVISLGPEVEGVFASRLRGLIPCDGHQSETIAVALRDKVTLSAEEIAIAGAKRNPGQAGSRAQQREEDEVALRLLVGPDGAVCENSSDRVLRRDRVVEHAVHLVLDLADDLT